MTLYEKVKALCEKEGFEISNIGENIPNLTISKASVAGWKKGSKPRADKIKLIAEYFGVDAEYLTDDSITSPQFIRDNHGIIGDTHAPVTIMNGDAPPTQQESELLNIFRNLSVIDQAKLLVYAEGLKTGN